MILIAESWISAMCVWIYNLGKWEKSKVKNDKQTLSIHFCALQFCILIFIFFFRAKIPIFPVTHMKMNMTVSVSELLYRRVSTGLGGFFSASVLKLQKQCRQRRRLKQKGAQFLKTNHINSLQHCLVFEGKCVSSRPGYNDHSSGPRLLYHL